MPIIAGHTMINDRCTECGKEWLDIMHVDMSYLNALGYAHTGGINAGEIEQIMNEKKRRNEVFERVLADMRSG